MQESRIYDWCFHVKAFGGYYLIFPNFKVISSPRDSEKYMSNWKRSGSLKSNLIISIYWLYMSNFVIDQ